MKDAKGDILMVNIGSEEDNVLRTLHYDPYVFDGGKRVLFLVDFKGIKLFNKIMKHIRKGKPCNIK